MILAGSGHGHKRLGLSHSEADRERFISFVLPYLAEENPQAVISGCGSAFDETFALAALRLGLPLFLVVAFADQHLRWPAHEHGRYLDILSKAAEVVRVEESCLISSGRRGSAMKKQARHIVGKADKVLVLNDGERKSQAGLVSYMAAKAGKPVRNIWPAWQEQRGDIA